MAWDNLLDLLADLENDHELVRVERPVTTRYEIAAFIRKSSDTDGPAFRFTNIKETPGWHAVGGLYNYRRVARILGVPVSGIVDRYRDAVAHPVDPIQVKHAPCQEVVVAGSEVDLGRLPIPVHSADDAGAYITNGVLMTRDPESGVRAMGIHRIQVLGPRRLGINAPGERRVSRALFRAEERGEPLPIALAIGAGPYVDLGSQAKVSHRIDKVSLAGGLKGGPIALVPGVVHPVEVPAESQIILEGRLLPGVREMEGPFGEVTGTYGEADVRPVIEVDAITQRKGAVYHTVLTGMPTTENHVMAWPAICDAIKRFAEQATPDVVDVHAIGPNYVAIVSIKKRMTHEARNVILSVLGPATGSPGFKYCIVVDDDIDVRNWNEVLWALYTRVQPDRDILQLPIVVGSPLDPSAPEWRHSAKMGFDATRPLGQEGHRFRRVTVPGQDEVSW